ncbi:Addiction module antidote protein, HigA family [uncultured Desulfobacterium sp.]|uniref:Addiction module antidote protein, HigA family n=1 Tax=uncultured Desulfobacterium sp. TaxID=201089 RepID=A0A445MWZ8_9BACT|nr:Addiction module antidote protein, HigA family [uncultured Desulfobacterium sp.]
MGNRIANQYIPDSVSPPGETLQETLEALGMSQADLAERTGHTPKMINEIIKGKAPITPRMSIELERVLDIPASFWNNRERDYRENLARREEHARLEEHVKWLDSIPVSDMVKWGWIKGFKEKVPQLQEALRFFGIASPDQWQAVTESLGRQVAYRKSNAFTVDNGALMAWLRKGQLDAKQIHCKDYDEKTFRATLNSVRNLTVEPPEVFQQKLPEMCSACGVAVVFVPELPKTRVSGATRWLTASKALIQLSLRYKSDDHLWFSFFHEAGHIIKHGRKDIFIEGSDISMDDNKEEEANRFAAECLIPLSEYNRLVGNAPYSKAKIRELAAQLCIAPGIVVGRLQHDGLLPVTHCNDLKKRFKWAR